MVFAIRSPDENGNLRASYGLPQPFALRYTKLSRSLVGKNLDLEIAPVCCRNFRVEAPWP